MSTETTPRFPDVDVQLSGEDGNVFSIIGRVTRAMKRGGATTAEVEEFIDEATSGDYDNALQTCFRWVNVL